MRQSLLVGRRVGALTVVLVLALLGGGAGAVADTGTATAAGPVGSGDVSGSYDSVIVDNPLVLATAAVRDGTPVDGIPSGPMVAGGFHIHAHLAVFVDGVQAWIPAGIGVTRPIILDPTRPDPVVTAAAGYYWLHTHDESGVIHAEAPEAHPFTLGEFFDVWGQPLSEYQVGPAFGKVTVLVDGQRYRDDPRTVPITSHTKIQLNVGEDVAFQPYDFPSNF